MNGWRLIGEFAIIFGAFELMFTSKGFGFAIENFWDWVALGFLVVGLILAFKGGIGEDLKDVN